MLKNFLFVQVLPCVDICLKSFVSLKTFSFKSVCNLFGGTISFALMFTKSAIIKCARNATKVLIFIL